VSGRGIWSFSGILVLKFYVFFGRSEFLESYWSYHSKFYFRRRKGHFILMPRSNKFLFLLVLRIQGLQENRSCKKRPILFGVSFLS
jgi:hypothetical protein